MDVSIWFWVGFHVFVLALLTLDLGVFNRKAHAISLKEAGIFSAMWVSLALLFNAGLYFFAGPKQGLEFLTGYLIEYSLSVDNIFVFVLIFSAFAVPAQFQHRVLFWGIVGALLLRGTLIGVGSVLVEQFSWVLYLFGAFLVVAGLRMLRSSADDHINLETNPVLKLVRRLIPITDSYDGQKFFTHQGARRLATPLFVVLILVEFTDVLFALDSIPAIFAITQDPFIVYTSNVFAILGLRSLYFLLAGVVDKFVFLRYGLAVVLAFVGAKLLLAEVFRIPNLLSLGVIIFSLVVSILASLYANRHQQEVQESVVDG